MATPGAAAIIANRMNRMSAGADICGAEGARVEPIAACGHLLLRCDPKGIDDAPLMTYSFPYRR